ncbi:hypothetical protein [Pseudomonas sp. ALK-5]|uniref:hypothetical protein n=1 Tax=Pseudomonas sp. ALK-5 TaxID=3411798 RepID=UPI003BA2BE40
MIADDGVLVGTNTWGARHTTSIISQILKKPAELRALAWAEALTLQLPIGEAQQTSDFALALNIGYQLEAERELIHRTCFVLRDLRIATERGVRLPAQGRFTLDAVETLPSGTGKAPYWFFTRDEMATFDD